MSRYISWLSEFNVGLASTKSAIASCVLVTPKGFQETPHHNFDPSRRGWLSHFPHWYPDDLFTKSRTWQWHILTSTWPRRSLRTLFEINEPPKYWSRSALLDFQCSNEIRLYWLVQYGTGEIPDNSNFVYGRMRFQFAENKSNCNLSMFDLVLRKIPSITDIVMYFANYHLR